MRDFLKSYKEKADNRRDYFRRASLEIERLKNGPLNPCERTSVVFFTMHKAASIYSGELLKDLLRPTGMTIVDFDKYFWNGGGTSQSWYDDFKERQQAYAPEDQKAKLLFDESREYFRSHGYFYGPFRKFEYGIPDLEEFKIVLSVRDIRDALVSLYFSIRNSHVYPLKGLRGQLRLFRARRRATKQSIDEFVLERCNNRYLQRYKAYSELIGKPNVLLIKYEDMVNDFESWLNGILSFLEVERENPVVERILAEANFRVEANINNHKRQVTSGDHKRKLRQETIDELTRRTEGFLSDFGYERRVDPDTSCP